jgi:hypothetical protein
MLSVITLSVDFFTILLNVIMQSIIMLNDIYAECRVTLKVIVTKSKNV